MEMATPVFWLYCVRVFTLVLTSSCAKGFCVFLTFYIFHEEMNISSSNTAADNGPIELCQVDPHHQITAVCFLIVFALSIIGNGLLVSALVCLEDLHRVSNLFFLCLASFDLLFTFTLPFWAVYQLHHWIFGDTACKFLIGAYFVGQNGSLILLTAMTLDRFCTVVLKGWYTARPGCRLCGARVVCATTWIISIAMSLRYVLNSTVQGEDGMYLCESGEVGELEDKVWQHIHIVFLFLLPLVIIVFCYSCIVRKVVSGLSMRGRNGTLVLLFSIVIAFFTCWGPYNVVLYLLMILDLSVCETERRIHLAYVICRILAYSHCCINPLLYMLRPRFRKLFCRLVTCSAMSINQFHIDHNAAEGDKRHKNTMDDTDGTRPVNKCLFL